MGRFLRLLVGLSLTALALWLADPSAVLSAASTARPSWILAAVALVAADRALMAYRWIVLVRALGRSRRVPLGVVLRVFFVSTFVGTFLPSVGGDAARALALARHDVSKADAAASVLMDRLLGVWSLLLVACVALWNAGALGRDPRILVTLALAAAGCAGAGLLLSSDRAAATARRLIARLPFDRVRHAADRLFDSVLRYRDRHGALFNVTLGSIGVQILRVVQAYCLGRALSIAAPLSVYFALIPVILLVMLVPVTIYGLGTSQIGFVWLFGTAGVREPQAFALSVLFVALGAVGNLPGGFIYATGAGARAAIAETDR